MFSRVELFVICQMHKCPVSADVLVEVRFRRITRLVGGGHDYPRVHASPLEQGFPSGRVLLRWTQGIFCDVHYVHL